MARTKYMKVVLGGGVAVSACPKGEDWLTWYRTTREYAHYEILKALPPLAYIREWGKQWKNARRAARRS